MKRIFLRPAFMILSLTLCLLSSCKRDDELEGPAFYFAPEGFNVLSFTASAPAADFTSGNVMFNASFTHHVSWVLTITGSESGAVKEYRGIGNEFSGITWDGKHDQISFFRTGEKAVATLSFMGTLKTTWSTEVTITKARDYTSYGIFPVAGDFEDISQVSHSTGWARFNLSDQGIGSAEKDLSGRTIKAVQGTNYFYLRDRPLKVAQFVNGVRYEGVLSAIPANADSVWVNVYVYGAGNKTTQMNFEFKEEDFDGAQPDHQDEEDDAMVATIFPSHQGWKLYSFKYSSLKKSASALFGGSGNGIHEPHRIKDIQFSLLKTGSQNKQTELYFDFPIITIGGPFDPTK